MVQFNYVEYNSTEASIHIKSSRPFIMFSSAFQFKEVEESLPLASMFGLG